MTEGVQSLRWGGVGVSEKGRVPSTATGARVSLTAPGRRSPDLAILNPAPRPPPDWPVGVCWPVAKAIPAADWRSRWPRGGEGSRFSCPHSRRAPAAQPPTPPSPPDTHTPPQPPPPGAGSERSPEEPARGGSPSPRAGRPAASHVPIAPHTHTGNVPGGVSAEGGRRPAFLPSLPQPAGSGAAERIAAGVTYTVCI